MFGSIKVGPLELVASLLEPVTGSNPLREGCGPDTGLSAGLCQISLFGARIFGALLWALIFAAPAPSIRRRIKIIELGSKQAYEQYVQEQNTPEPLGELVGVSNNKGGLLTTSEATIETTKGFYRVAGLAGTLERGAPVYLLHGHLLIGDGASRKEFLVLT